MIRGLLDHWRRKGKDMARQGLYRLAVWAALVCLTLPAIAGTSQAPVRRNGALDANLTTTFSLYDHNTQISWVTCGSTAESEGCYGSGSITGLTHACAMLEGASTTSGQTVTRNIYILDMGDTSDAPSLKVFEMADVFTDSYVTTTITLYNTVQLPLTTGGNCAMAANQGVILAGTSQSFQAAKFNLSDYTVQAVGGFTPQLPVTQITANDAGYVLVTFGSGRETGQSGFYVYGPDGSSIESGPGMPFLGNSLNAFPLH